MTILTRRAMIGSMGASGLLLSGCDRIAAAPAVRTLLRGGETLTHVTQGLVTDRSALAPEYRRSEMSPVFRTNGNTLPSSDSYRALAASNFADWRLILDGLIRAPGSYTLAQLRAMPTRTQITRHDCVEGWSAIGEWTGVPLRILLGAAGLMPGARYLVFHCADDFNGTPYYESLDLAAALHPQTLLAWGMNGEMLSVGHGAPLRLRVERQLGYKQAKYVMRIEAVSTLSAIAGGGGGYWEDRAGYQWYAGI